MEKCLKPRAALVVPVDLTVAVTLFPQDVGEDRGEDFLAFLALLGCVVEVEEGGVVVVLLLLVVEGGVKVDAAGEGVWATTPASMDDASGDEIPALEFALEFAFEFCKDDDMEATGRLLLLLLLPRLSSATEALLLLLGIAWWWRPGGSGGCGGCGPWCGGGPPI